MKITKRIVSLLVLSGILAASMLGFCGSAAAAVQDTGKSGWYFVVTGAPEDHTYCYIYDEPSSSNGKNLCRVNDGEQVYVYRIGNGTGKKSTKWAYCEYEGMDGYIRWDNLSVTKPASKSMPVPANGSYIEMSGNANIRAGAGKNYNTVGSIGNGSRAEYLNEAEYDERSVLWYKINYSGTVGWVSSMYANLVGNANATSAYVADSVDDEAAASSTELSDFYLKDLKKSAIELGLPNYRRVTSEAPDTYSDESLTIGGDLELASVVSYFDLFGEGYKVYGVTIGMSIEQAKRILAKTNLTMSFDNSGMITCKHPSGPNTLIDCDGYDSVIYFDYWNGVVTDILWCTYTG